ncbi:M24 family metallopeptidase [Pseudaquabacterium rugosum]|jgi:Xaa-Pro aminopeptidase|uniref:Xaa-Pro peptidase family protein n=1 Tax=Pseudaquabacterium rugosum TaxID=2984194 RepID=A0ABU9BGD7_9BURK
MTILDWHGAQADDTDPAGWGRDGTEVSPPPDIDLAAVRRYRLARVRAEMQTRGIDALLISDPVNIRYATGARNMQIFCARNAPSRYLLLTPTESILHEFTGCEHLAAGLETISEVRASSTASFVAAGPQIVQRERAWAAEMADTVRERVGPQACLGLERLNAGVAIALSGCGLRIVDAQEPIEMARAIKSAAEVQCIEASLRATERAVGRLREAIRPGITENALWSILHQSVIAQDGDYVETRLLSSGPRANPWFQETSSRVIEADELIALDTDVVGCHGYYSDFSRTFHAGPNRPTAAQRTLYQLAHEQVHHNMDVIRPGLSFREYSERAWNIPARYHANRYYLSAHGCGMTGEYPYLYHHADFPASGYDGEIRPGMTLCVESYIGEAGGREGVKLEQQLLVTDTGTRLLSRFPFEDALLA